MASVVAHRGPAHDSVRTTPQTQVGLTADRAMMVLAAALGLLIGSGPIADNSFLTHLATGRLIVETGAVPSVDPYSYTAHGDPWVVQSWLVSVIYAWLEDVGGWVAIRGFHGLCLAAVLMGVWRFTGSSDRMLPRVALFGVVVTALAAGTGPRPLLVGLVGVVLVRGGQLGWFRPWVMAPVAAVWVNSHGSFPLAVAILGCSGLVELVWHRRLNLRTLQLGLASVVGIVAGAYLGPLDDRILRFPVELLGRREVLDQVVEWAPWALTDWTGVCFLVMTVLLCGAAGRGMSAPDGVVAGAMAITGFLAVRNIPAAVVLIAAAVAPALRIRWGAIRSSTRGIVPVGLMLCAGLVGLLGVAGLAAPSFVDDRYPAAEVDWLEERQLVASPSVNLLTSETTGNYLEVRFGTSARVFTDDRFDFYPIEFQHRFHELLASGPYDAPLDQWEVDVVLWPSQTGLVRWLDQSPDWVVVDLPDGTGPNGTVPELSEPHSVVCRVWLADRCR